MPVLVYYYVAETNRWQCCGGGIYGIGSTREIAEANWREDYTRWMREMRAAALQPR